MLIFFSPSRHGAGLFLGRRSWHLLAIAGHVAATKGSLKLPNGSIGLVLGPQLSAFPPGPRCDDRGGANDRTQPRLRPACAFTCWLATGGILHSRARTASPFMMGLLSLE